MEHAVALLRAGELVAFPTETVYGLGADAANPAALAKIFAAKGRPADHPVIVHIPDISHLPQWARDIPDAALQLAQAFWPGPLTLILKRQRGGANEVPDLVTGGQDTVGLRIPNHPLALQLLRAFGGGIAAPSANRFGRISPTTAAHVREELGDAVKLVLDGGPCAVGIESTIVDLSRCDPVILRPGMIGAEQIEQVLHHSVRPESFGEAQDRPVEGRASTPRVSGSLDAHYAPRTPMQLIEARNLPRRIQEAVGDGGRVAVLAQHEPAAHGRVIWHAAASDPGRYAHDLYAKLRAMDHAGVDLILVESPPRTPEWVAVNDRLQRASRGAGKG